MLGSLIVALALILANGFFVAAEFAIVRVRSTQLDLRVATGSRSARIARGILEHLDAYLSACQLGITLASLGLGWIAEPLFESLLYPVLSAVGVGTALSHKISVIVGFSVISGLHIVLGEQAPKNLAIQKAEATALVVAVPLRVTYLVVFPFLWLLNAASNGVLRLVGIRVTPGHGLAMPADELRQIAAESVAEGQITRGEGRLLSRVFTFSDRIAREIMVPRSKVLAIDLATPVDQALTFALENGQSRYPLYENDLDGVVGVLHMKDLTRRLVEGPKIDSLRELGRPALFVPESVPAQRLLRMFQRKRIHLAMLLDEFGGVTGIATLEDALEELVGEIQDEHDEEVPPVLPIRGGYSVEGRVAIPEIEELLEVTIESEATTVAGYVMERLGRVGTVGDRLTLGPWQLRVTNVDRRAIERIEIVRLESEEPTSGAGEPSPEERRARGLNGRTEVGSEERDAVDDDDADVDSLERPV